MTKTTRLTLLLLAAIAVYAADLAVRTLSALADDVDPDDEPSERDFWTEHYAKMGAIPCTGHGTPGDAAIGSFVAPEGVTINVTLPPRQDPEVSVNESLRRMRDLGGLG